MRIKVLFAGCVLMMFWVQSLDIRDILNTS